MKLTFSHKVVTVTFGVLLLLVILTSVQAQPRVVDGDTRFHRVYVTGPGEKHFLWHEENGFKDDRDELKNDLEKAGNQAAGSTSQTLDKPTQQKLKETLNALKGTAQPGEEVTLCFIAHGNGGKPRKPGDGGIDNPGEGNDPYDEWIWLNDKNGNKKANRDPYYPGNDEILTDDELAAMLQGFKESVTIVIIMDSCFGGGFTNGATDIQESDHVAVIGTPGKCPVDPPGIFGGFRSTLTEDVADGGGEKEADKNEDCKVTAAELKEWLEEESWTLGPPDDTKPGKKIKNGKSKIIGLEGVLPELPSITPETFTPFPESYVILEGRNFASYSLVDINFVKPDLTQLDIGYAETDQNGSFTTTITIPNIPTGQYLLIAEDVEENLDWDILAVGVGVGGIAVPIDMLALLAPYIGLTSMITVVAVGTVVTIVFVKRSRKEK